MQILGGEKWAIWEKERSVDLVIKRAVYMIARKNVLSNMYITLINSVTISLNILHFNVFFTLILFIIMMMI